MASGATTKRTTKKKLMPWEGGEPEYVELPERTPEQQASLDEFFEARRRGYMTAQQMWMCVMKAHEVRSSDGKIYRY
jgi:hypothetical protein